MRRELPKDRPTVPKVAPLVKAHFAKPGKSVGCCLHIVLDDGNADDDSVRFCIQWAKDAGEGHEDCVALGEKLLLMSKTQRLKLRLYAYPHLKDEGMNFQADEEN